MKQNQFKLRNQSLVFIGAGKMAEAILSRLISQAVLEPQNIVASDVDEDRLSFLKEKYKIKTTASNKEAIDHEGPIILAVKPQNISELLSDLGSDINNRLVVSIAAGINTEKIESYLPEARVVRVMPNTAALVGKAITAVSRGKTASDADIEAVKEIFKTVGETTEVEENLQNAVTAVSGSGPAYFFILVELLAEAGSSIGLNEEQSIELATQTAIGAGELLKTRKTARELREMVTSKGGTTEAALEAFQENKLSDIVIKAVQQAFTRAKEISEA